MKLALDKEKIALPELANYLAAAKNYKGYKSPDQESQLRDIEAKREELARSIQAENAESLRKEIRESFERKAIALDLRLSEKKAADFAEAEKECAGLSGEKDRILAEYASKFIDKDFLSSMEQQMNERIQSLQNRIQGVEKYQEISSGLLHPESMEIFSEALQNALSGAPELFIQFRHAQEQTKLLKERKTAKDVLDGTMELTDDIYQKLKNAKDPYCKDVFFMMSDPLTFEQIRMKIDVQLDNISSWKLLEVELPVQDKAKIYFYVHKAEDVFVERSSGGSGSAYRSLLIQYQTSDNTTGVTVYKIVKEDASYILTRTRDDSGKLPPTISDIPATVLAELAKGEFQIARHASLWESTLARMKGFQTSVPLEDFVSREIYSYAQRDDLNPSAQGAILKNLLNIYALFSGYSEKHYKALKEVFPSSMSLSWKTPEPPSGKTYTKGLDAVKLKAENTRHLYGLLNSQLPVPAGVIYLDSGTGLFTCHFFKDAPASGEYFVCLENQDDMQYYILPDELIKNKEMEVSLLKSPFAEMQNGTVFYARFSDEVQPVQTKDVFQQPKSLPVRPEGALKNE